MSTILPPGAQTPQPQPQPAAQAAPTAVVREPSTELLRAAAGTRIEGTVLPQPQAPQSTPAAQGAQATKADAARIEAARAAVQTLQTAVDNNRTDAARTDLQRTDGARDAARATQQASPQITVRTPSGDVTLRTPLPIPEGARVAVDVVSTSANQITVRFVSVNGQPIQQALLQLAADRAAAPPLATAPASTGPLGQAAPTPLSFGQVWTPGGPAALTQAGPQNAFMLAGTPAGQTTASSQAPGLAAGRQASNPGAPSPLFTGADLTIRITSVSPGQPGAAQPGGGSPTVPTNTVGQASSQAQPNTSPQATTGAPSATPGQSTQTPGATTSGSTAPVSTTPSATTALQTTSSPQGPGSLLPPGGNNQSGLRLTGSQGWPAPPFATPSNGQTAPLRVALTGLVTAQSTAAQTVIQTDAGTLQLANRVNLPPGTTVTLDVLAQNAPRTDATGTAVTAPPSAATSLPFTAGTAPWPALTEALQVLQRVDPQAGQLLANTIPDGGPRTIAAALSFIQAMRTGDPRQWPGDNNLRALERAGPRGAHLARTVSGEVAQLSAQSREATGDWRSTPIPWNADAQIEKINLISRREDAPDDDEKNEADNKKSGLRFLLDLDLTNLGALQLDGMVREETKGFDLMIRSLEPLGDSIRRDLTGLFIAANQAVGLKGQLTFQVTHKFADPVGSSEPLKLERDGVWA